jgi:hypothetical protein
MQTCNYFISTRQLEEVLVPLDRAVALIAAAIHDFRHDGVNNVFHIASMSPLAIQYNDTSVLECYHVAEAFKIMKQDLSIDIFQGLCLDEQRSARSLMIDMVLGTDMSKHFEDITLFKAKICPGEDEDFTLSDEISDKKLLLKVMLHTCDVSNPAKERSVMLRWTDRVVEEFFRQGDREKALGLKVSPFMDRESPTLKKQQTGFIEFIVRPLLEVWINIVPCVELDGIKNIQENKKFWEDQGDGIMPADMGPIITELTGEPHPESYPYPETDDASGKSQSIKQKIGSFASQVTSKSLSAQSTDKK